jgi:hypothetical protein
VQRSPDADNNHSGMLQQIVASTGPFSDKVNKNVILLYLEITTYQPLLMLVLSEGGNNSLGVLYEV